MVRQSWRLMEPRHLLAVLGTVAPLAFGSACQASEVTTETWEIRGAVDPSDEVVHLAVIGASCDGSSPSSTIDRVEVEEGPQSVTITVRVLTELPRFGGCTAAGIFLTQSVELSEPLGDRRLIDSGRQP